MLAAVTMIMAVLTPVKAFSECGPNSICLPKMEARDCAELSGTDKEKLLTKYNKCKSEIVRCGKEVQAELDRVIGKLNSCNQDKKDLQLALKLSDRALGAESLGWNSTDIANFAAIGSAVGSGAACAMSGCDTTKEIGSIPASIILSWGLAKLLGSAFEPEPN